MLEKRRPSSKIDGVNSVLSKSLELTVRRTKYAVKAIYFKVSPTGIFNCNEREQKRFQCNFNFAYDNGRTVEFAVISTFLKSLGRNVKFPEVGNVIASFGQPFTNANARCIGITRF